MSFDTPPWYAFGGGSALIVFVGWVARHVFSSAVRQEFAGMHAENQRRFLALETRLANIEGRMEERWRIR